MFDQGSAVCLGEISKIAGDPRGFKDSVDDSQPGGAGGRRPSIRHAPTLGDRPLP
jgi:hypothetical protein